MARRKKASPPAWQPAGAEGGGLLVQIGTATGEWWMWIPPACTDEQVLDLEQACLDVTPWGWRGLFNMSHDIENGPGNWRRVRGEMLFYYPELPWWEGGPALVASQLATYPGGDTAVAVGVPWMTAYGARVWAAAMLWGEQHGIRVEPLMYV